MDTIAEGVKSLSAIVKPMQRILGTNLEAFCLNCFHGGHGVNDLDDCPVYRLESLMDPEKKRRSILS